MFSRSLLIAVLCTVVAVSFAEHQRLHGLKAAEHHRSRHHGLNKLNRERSAYQHTICNILCSGNNTVTTGPTEPTTTESPTPEPTRLTPTGSPTPEPTGTTTPEGPSPPPSPTEPTTHKGLPPSPTEPTTPEGPTPSPTEPTTHKGPSPSPTEPTTPEGPTPSPTEPTTTGSPTPEPIDPTPTPLHPSTPKDGSSTQTTTTEHDGTTPNNTSTCVGVNVCYNRHLALLFGIINNFYKKDSTELINIFTEVLYGDSKSLDLITSIRVLLGLSSDYNLREAVSVYITNLRKLIGKGSIKINAGLYAVLSGEIGFSGLVSNSKGKSGKLESDAAIALILATIFSIRVTVTGESYTEINGKLGAQFDLIIKVSEKLELILEGKPTVISGDLNGCVSSLPNLTIVSDRSHGVAHHLVKEHGHHANKAHHLVKEHGHHANKAHHLVKEHGHHANKAHHLVKEHGHHANKAHHEVKEHHGHHANKAHHEVKEHHGHHANKAHHEVKEHHGHHANKAHHDHHANKAHHQVKEHHDHHANKAHHQVKEHHGNNVHHANKAHSTNHHENKHHHANKEHHHHGSNQ
ncbi:PREDICTED: lateral signaling target protein 2 homolog [Nicrophorus vespilloides]|uniref:Lateral signaling target protein 2 homolog n=1 Tax=Nicrophorus vespilloides TaxID=110193 RepID=A0ABM1NHT7_NICVS|nr:PREDICTED: lateral signaling target protein 2 homolog [Nicrophorus vespilloides]